MCGQILTKKNISEHDPYICSKCYKKINFVQSPCCMKCSRPLVDDTREYCIDCSNKIRHFDAGMALMIHDDISRKIIYDLKYAGRRDNADMIGYELTKRAGALIRQWDPQVVIPVPVHKSKRIQRGFNQAETLALKLRTQIPVDCDYLIRHKKTLAQKELIPELRRRNITGAFSVHEYRKPYSSVLLVDDIYTSGSTLSECARVLKEKGVKKVYFLTGSIVAH